MKSDFRKWAAGEQPDTIVSKETLNNPELIRLASGRDPYTDSAAAFCETYRALGIDLVNRVPLENAPEPTADGEAQPHASKPDYCRQHLGVYDSMVRSRYPCATVEDVWELDMETVRYEDLLTPVPHPCRGDDIKRREAQLGDVGCYYPMLYTTLFMWGVEVLGWTVFMEAAFLEPDRFHEHFLLPCVEKSRRIVAELAAHSECPFVFVHDDWASGTGPVFPPSWYDDYIFPHYDEILAPAREAGKKVCLVADGNMSVFLPKMIELGIDGFMFENPATPLDAVIEHFGAPGRYFIGGIETARLTLGTPDDVRSMVHGLVERAGDCPGFAMATVGGLHGNVPVANLESYMDARVDVGVTPKNWRHNEPRGMARS